MGWFPGGNAWRRRERPGRRRHAGLTDSQFGEARVCDNPEKTERNMGPYRIALVKAVGLVLSGALVCATALPAMAQQAAAGVPLVLEGGTVVDVADWGRSAKDLQDAIVVVREGRIAEVGSRQTVAIPKGARVIDCTGKYILPGLVDGFAGMASQNEANANLYMGVTTVVATSQSHR